jgi:hypothetical protein
MKMITANRLTDGRVLYWTAAQGWTPNIGDAAQLDDVNAESELALALKDEATEVAGPYLIEAADGRPAGRERLKETIRLEGPTTGSSKTRASAHGEAKAG